MCLSEDLAQPKKKKKMNKQNNTKTRLLLQKGKWGLLSAMQDLLLLSQHLVLGDKTTRPEHTLTAGEVDHTQVVPSLAGLAC